MWEGEDGITLAIKAGITSHLTCRQAFFSTRIGVILEDGISIVIATVVTTEDTVGTALYILHEGSRFQHFWVEGCSCDLLRMIALTPDGTAKVVTAIDIIPDPWETAIMSDIHLGTTVDVGIAGTTEGIIDAAVAQVDIRIANHITFVTATIDILRLGEWQARHFLRVAGIRTFHVDGTAVAGIIDVLACFILLTDDTFLTTTEDLESIAVVQVDGSTAPNLGFLTITSTKHCHGHRLCIVALGLAEHAGTAVTTDGVFVFAVGLGKDDISLDQVLVDVDDHITVYVTAVVAAAIDVTTQQTTLLVVRSSSTICSSTRSTCSSTHEVILIRTPQGRVPLQLVTFGRQFIILVGATNSSRLCTLGNEFAAAQVRGVIFLASLQLAIHKVFSGNLSKRVVPTSRLDRQVIHVQLDTVLDLACCCSIVGIIFVRGVSALVLCTQNTSAIGRIILASLHIGIVTTSHDFLKDNQTTVNVIGVLASNRHASHVTTAVERTNLTGIVFIGIWVAIRRIIEHDSRL